MRVNKRRFKHTSLNPFYVADRRPISITASYGLKEVGYVSDPPEHDNRYLKRDGGILCDQNITLF